jgi:hypothetical protein
MSNTIAAQPRARTPVIVAWVLQGLPALGLAGPAALWLGCTMIGAIIAHLTALHTPAVPPAVLLLLNLVVAWLRRDQILALIGR